MSVCTYAAGVPATLVDCLALSSRDTLIVISLQWVLPRPGYEPWGRQSAVSDKFYLNLISFSEQIDSDLIINFSDKRL